MLTLTFDRNTKRMVNKSFFWICEYLSVGDALHAEQVAIKLAGIIRAQRSEKCQRRNNKLRLRSKQK